jgi:hypothetical protein
VRNRWKLVIALSALAIGSSPVAAQSGYLLAENLGYTGTVTCYATLSDALGGVGATCSAAIPQRDLSLYFVQNNPAFAGSGYPPSAAIFLTNWYAGGGSNPNNTNVGFMQMYDDGAGSVSSMSMGWNPTLTNHYRLHDDTAPGLRTSLERWLAGQRRQLPLVGRERDVLRILTGDLQRHDRCLRVGI